MKLPFVLVWLVLVALIESTHLFAQSGAGSISGSVHDPTGAVVPADELVRPSLRASLNITRSVSGAARLLLVVSDRAEDRSHPRGFGFSP